MKRIFCPKCDHQLAFDETKYREGKVLVFVCPQCAHPFKIRLGGGKKARTETGEEQEVEVSDFSCGGLTVIENSFGYRQELPLAPGDNVVGRRNRDTDGVDVPIITNDPSMGRKHCIINVRQAPDGTCTYTLRDFPSLTGTFLRNKLLKDRERVRLEDGDVITIGATSLILKAR